MVENVKKLDSYYKKALDDLRAPVCEEITALASILRLTQEKLGKEEKELIELTLKSCSYVRKSIDMLDDIYKIESKSFKLDYETFDFLKLIDSVTADLELVLSCEGVKVEFKNREAVFLKADKRRVEMALETLFLSALNYIKRDSSILVSFECVKNKFKFEIGFKSDELDEDELQTLFEKEKTVKSCFLGTGLNYPMYLVKLVVSRHFGQLVARNKDGITTFGFVLPM